MFRSVVSLVTAVLISASSVAAQTGQTMRIKDNRVHLRSAASVDSSIVKTLSKGTTVTIMATDGGWSKVQVQGQSTQGWIRSDLLVAEPQAADMTATTTPPPAAAAPNPPPARAVNPPTPARMPPPPAPTRTPPPPPPPHVSGPPSGQHGGLELFGGLTSFKLKETASGVSETSGTASGFMAGFGIVAPAGNHFGIEIDFAYLQNGSASTGSPKITEHTNTASGSFLLRPSFGNGSAKLILLAGGYGRFAINCKESPATAGDCTINSDENRFGYGAEVGAGIMFGRLTVQGRYDIGLANLTKVDGYTVKSTGFIIMGGFVL